MIRLSLRSMLSRKLRTALTALAIFLGVAMISGTYVLTDQISNGFAQIYDQAYSKVDVALQRKAEFGSTAYGPVGYMPESTLAQVKAADGVKEAVGYVYGLGSVVIDGKAIATGGAPTIVYSFDPKFADFEPDVYVAGAPPTRPNQVGVIKQLADKQHLAVGSVIGLTTEQGTEQVTVSGIFTFADSKSLGGATVVHTTLADAQKWYEAPGQLSEIYASAEPGVTPDELAARIRAVVPADVQVKTGQQTAADTTGEINQAFGFIRSILLAFGGVAVLVGAFIIFNTFSITVAQRLREFAMIRTLGGSRRQVLWSVVGEALAMGLVASVAGLLGGVGLAKGLNAVFHAAGADIPTAGLALRGRTIAVSLAVGLGVTLVAALLPGWRATRVPPIAALREGAALPHTRFGRYSAYLAVAPAAGGVAALVAGLAGSGSVRTRILEMLLGVILIFLATSMVAKFLVPPLVGVIGWPLRRLARASGRLASENSVRNPSRTALTAAAMMIGLAVVVFVAVFAQSLRSSFVGAFEQSVAGEFVITSAGSSEQPLPGGTMGAVRAVWGVSDVSGIGVQRVQADGKEVGLYGVSPADIGGVWRFDWLKGGSDQLIGRLEDDNVLVEEQTALDHHLGPGSTIEILTQQGKTATLHVIGEYRDPVMMNGLTMSDIRFGELFEGTQSDPYFLLVGVSAGADRAQVQRGLETGLKAFPTVKVYTKGGYVKEVSLQVNQMLMIFYALLAMSVIISLFGIVNTLVLAVYERTREIGMLRAIGTSRRQVRRMVRYESVITAVIGAMLGIVLGAAFGYVVITDLGSVGFSFSLPVLQLVIFLIVAVVAGVVAAILPAARASRLNILEAIHYE